MKRMTARNAVASVLVFVLLVLGNTSAYAVPTPAPAKNATKLITLYVAPQKSCSANNNATSQKTAVCTLAQASDIADKMWANGRARGNVDVRIAPGEYAPASTATHTWSFAPAKGAKVRIIPTWYTTDAAAAVRPVSDYPYFNGKTVTQKSSRPLAIRPDKNFGGEYELAYVRAENFNNGVLVDGGWIGDPDDSGGDALPGVFRGKNAPMKVTVRDSVLRNIGNIHSLAPTDSYAALHLINTKGAVVRGVLFENIEEDVATYGHHLHAIYGYGSTSTTVKANTFIRVSSDPIRMRDSSHDWYVTGNTFKRAGYAANTSEWYCNVECAGKREKQRFAECPSIAPTITHNTTDKLNYDGRPLAEYAPWNSSVEAPCTSKARVFVPNIDLQSVTQIADRQVVFTWKEAAKNGAPAARYDVYLDGTRVAQLPTTTRKYALKNVAPSADHEVSVRAVAKSGEQSPRTANRFWVNLEPYADSNVIAASGLPAPIPVPLSEAPSQAPSQVPTAAAPSDEDTPTKNALIVAVLLAALCVGGGYSSWWMARIRPLLKPR